MTITDTARKRIEHLRRKSSHPGATFRVTGYIGTCRGSTPVIKPAEQPAATDTVERCGSVTLAIAEEHSDLLAEATLDFESGFMGRGLVLTWPHTDHCHCQGT